MSSSKRNQQDHNNRRAVGHGYETLASEYYQTQGYQVMHRNWQAGHKEIDLVVRTDDTVVFVEVKSSSTDRFGHPSERVDKKKRVNLTQAARQYLMEEKLANVNLRFDLITFVNGKLEHYPNAFEATESE